MKPGAIDALLDRHPWRPRSGEERFDRPVATDAYRRLLKQVAERGR
jgi:hypothetical protein